MRIGARGGGATLALLHLVGPDSGVLSCDIDGGTWLKFLGVYTMSLVVPHGLAFKHRKEGWDTAAEMH